MSDEAADIRNLHADDERSLDELEPWVRESEGTVSRQCIDRGRGGSPKPAPLPCETPSIRCKMSHSETMTVARAREKVRCRRLASARKIAIFAASAMDDVL